VWHLCKCREGSPPRTNAPRQWRACSARDAGRNACLDGRRHPQDPRAPRPFHSALSLEGRKMKLANQTAIVTGAGRNIGEETAKLFASEGAAVAVVDMDRARADKVANAIQ